MSIYTIGGINKLPPKEKRAIYCRLIPPRLFRDFNLPPELIDQDGQDLLELINQSGSSAVELKLFHEYGFEDPLLYGHLTDTLSGQIHVLLYVINNPNAPRFEVDRLPDGRPTKFGTLHRNIPAEEAALAHGLAPGQIRAGLRILSEAIDTFEYFVRSLGQEVYFIEPLFYHNAILFEKHGFNYQAGLRRMKLIQEGLSPSGDLTPLLDGSNPFRQPQAVNSIRLRSWAIHDGILGEPLDDIVMYKYLEKSAGIDTAPGIPW